MWFGDYKPNPKGPLNDIHKKEKTMVSQNRNLSQKLVVEERHTRDTSPATSLPKVLSTRKSTPITVPAPSLQVRRVSPPRPLKTWPTAPTRRTRNNKSCRSGSFLSTYRLQANKYHTAIYCGNHRPEPFGVSGHAPSSPRHRTRHTSLTVGQHCNTVTARTFSVRIRARPRGKDMS